MSNKNKTGQREKDNDLEQEEDKTCEQKDKSDEPKTDKEQDETQKQEREYKALKIKRVTAYLQLRYDKIANALKLSQFFSEDGVLKVRGSTYTGRTEIGRYYISAVELVELSSLTNPALQANGSVVVEFSIHSGIFGVMGNIVFDFDAAGDFKQVNVTTWSRLLLF